MMAKNPTKAEMRAYREKNQHGQGMDFEPLSNDELRSRSLDDKLDNERKEERRLDGSAGYEYLGADKHGLGSPIQFDNYDDESKP